MTEKRNKPTIAVHAGRMSKAHFGAVNTPVYRASTILFPDVETVEHGKPEYVYGRLGTPTSRSLEEALSELQGGARTVLCPSGLSAVTTAILAVVGAGDHLLVTDSCYGPARLFCEQTLKRFGVDVTYYDPLIGAGIADLFHDNTKAVFCESPGSLTFEVQDVPAIARAAHARGASVLMDNTWATPFFFDAFAHGVDLVFHSGSKYLGGHADVVMGWVTANEPHRTQLEDIHHHLGVCIGGDDCYLALRGLRTMNVRLKQQQQTALTLARWLERRPEVARVLHPAMEADPGHTLWRRDFTGSSGLFGLLFHPVSKSALATFVDKLSYFGIGYSWGGYESLIVPAHFTRTARPFGGQGPLWRIHAGLEDADDLIGDLSAGFERMRNAQ